MNKYLMLFILLASLAACGGGNGDNTSMSGTDFNNFVIDEILDTDANDEPAEINDITFNFNNDNESAFDAVL